MKRKLKWWVFGGTGLLIVALIGYFSLRRAVENFFYPPAPAMPPVVQTSTVELLRQFEEQLRRHSPASISTLQPGLSDPEIDALEAKGKFKLPDDLRALYRWHNGGSTNGFGDIIPGHEFPSLQRVVEDRLLDNADSATPLQRTVFNTVAGHTKTWLTIFSDGAGDGYFYDPKRRDAEGAFFYHLTEDIYFLYFPSFRNFLAATVECMTTNAYHLDKDGKVMEEDYDQASVILKKYGASSTPGE